MSMTTPAEPVFNLKPHQMSAENLQEWLTILIQENDSRMKSATVKQGFFKDGEYAECILNVCDKLRLPAEARYLAVELFEKFMVQHVRDLFGHVQLMDGDHKLKDWNAIVSRVEKQVVLRVMTCCELASKLTSHYRPDDQVTLDNGNVVSQILTPRKVWRTLSEFGHSYNTESILQSELRVVKSLDFRVMLTTPLTYIETILVLLGQQHTVLNVKLYHDTCLKVLDMTYMKRSQIFDSLFTLANGHPKKTTQDVEKFVKVQSDYVLLATGVIAAAVYVCQQESTNKMIELMSELLEIHANDMIDFATVIIQTLMPEH